MTDEQRQFLHDELFVLTLAGAFQHAGVYGDNVADSVKQEFRSALRRQLETTGARYRRTVTDGEHYANVETLAAGLSATFKGALRYGRFRIGCAQKALNLYLKYLWCLGEIGIPPHCPFDRSLLHNIGKRGPWTQCDDIAEYREWVDAAREAAGARTIAEWELAEFTASRVSSAAEARSAVK